MPMPKVYVVRGDMGIDWNWWYVLNEEKTELIGVFWERSELDMPSYVTVNGVKHKTVYLGGGRLIEYSDSTGRRITCGVEYDFYPQPERRIIRVTPHNTFCPPHKLVRGW